MGDDPKANDIAPHTQQPCKLTLLTGLWSARREPRARTEPVAKIPRAKWSAVFSANSNANLDVRFE